MEFSDDSAENYIIYDLNVPVNFTASTRGSLSRALLENNSWLSAGEQLTFVWCFLDYGTWNWRYWSLILDVSDSRPFPSYIENVTGSNGHLKILFNDTAGGDWLSATCVVRSQPYGESSFKRSTAILQLNPDEYLYNDDAAVRAAVASYRTGEDPEDWEEDPTPEYQQLAYVCMVAITEDMIITGSSPTIQGKECLGYVTKGGEMGIFYTYSTEYSANVLLDRNADILYGALHSAEVPYRYKATYQPAREYSTIYGHM